MIRLFKHYLLPYKRKMIFLFVALFCASLCNLTLPVISKVIINKGIANQNMQLVMYLGVAMISLLILAWGIMILVNKLSAEIALGFSKDLRHALFKHIGTLSPAELDAFGTSTLISRQINDINQVQMVLVQLLNVFLSAPLMCIGGVIMAYITAPRLSWILLLILPIVLLVMIAVLIQVNPLYRQNQKKLDHVNRILREILTGIRVIRAFNNEEIEEQRVSKASKDLMYIATKANKITISLMPIITLFINGANILIVWFGGHYMTEGLATYGDIQTFIQYAAMIMTAFAMTSLLMVALPRAATSAKRINEVFDKESTIKDPVLEAVIPADRKPSIEFKHVYFKYPGSEENVLTDISFKVKAGETLAIIGGTGSGKTTLLNLIARYYDASVGKILINECEIHQLKQNTLRRLMGIVPQKAFLFGGSIYDNVCYGKKGASKKEVLHALNIAQAIEFISQKEEGIYSHITPSGANVSGGQRQRIAIARAIVKKPQIYLFDDSFSALDFKTDAALRSALEEETKEAVTVIVAQRVGTIMNADQIIVLDHGQMMGKGKHKELLKTCPTYREIAYSQLPESEVDY